MADTRHFNTEHLQNPELRRFSNRFRDLAEKLNDELPESAEKSAGIRKLLEAKDCFVRAKLQDMQDNGEV